MSNTHVENVFESHDYTINNMCSVDALVLRSFISGLKPLIQEIVSWKEPTTFEVALMLAQKKELNLNSIIQPQVVKSTITTIVKRLI